MGGPAQRYFESLPPAQAEIVNGILDRLPQAQRPDALRVCRAIIERCGENAPEALRRFANIASSEHFAPSMLGTVSLIATRAGSNVVSTLNAFERLLSSDKFNRHVHEAARLSVIRAGADSNEALHALYFLIDNPSFTSRDIDISLPDRFSGFLDSAILAGGDQPYMAIRVMGRLFCNRNFVPADLSLPFAESFARQIGIIRADAGANRLEALEAFSALICNGSIRPREITEAAAHSVAALTNLVIERTASSVNDGSNVSEGPMRNFCLILGSSVFSLPMISEYGLLSAFLQFELLSMPSALDMFHEFMRAARRAPGVLELATQRAEKSSGSVVHPGILHLLTSIASNASLSPMFEDTANAGRFLSKVLSFKVHLFGALSDEHPSIIHEMPVVFVLSELARIESITPREWNRALSFADSLGDNADVGLYLLQRYMSGSPGREFPNESSLSGLSALVRQISAFGPVEGSPASSSDVDSIGRLSAIAGTVLASVNFDMGMLEQSGLIPNIRRFGEWARSYIQSVPQGERQWAINDLSRTFRSMLASSDLSAMLLNNPERFQDGQRLARQLIGGYVPPEICFNFAYAISTIGVERTTALYRRFGIRHFARYSPEILGRLYERASGRSARPAVLAIYPENDYNGAFYFEGRRLDSLLSDFDVVIYERDTEAGFFSAATDFSRSFGRTSTLIVAGHGSPNGIRFGKETDAGMLDLTDAREITALRSVLLPHPTIVLQACSTGKDRRSISGLLSRTLGGVLYAPRTPGNTSHFHISRGRVSATYNVDVGIFIFGREAGE
ncbi:hypothetical protein L0Y65_01190 [Candidatus Micrarchaeota archaeon]|nr:hypothetical protein [Candidatus Micrarchaeota archaeon]